jgi:protein-disulfide isomerase
MTQHDVTVRRFSSSILTALLLACATALQAQDTNKLMERAAQSRAKGKQGATVMVYEIADFQCPFCARFARDVFPKIDSAYVKTGKVQWFFVNLPLPNHGNAWPAAEAALCAGATADLFWPMHDRLFATQNEWAMARDPGPFLARVAKELGASGDTYTDCITGDRLAALLMQDIVFALNTRITGTPAFIVNNEQIVLGVKTFEEWQALLEAALKKK